MSTKASSYFSLFVSDDDIVADLGGLSVPSFSKDIITQNFNSKLQNDNQIITIS